MKHKKSFFVKVLIGIGFLVGAVVLFLGIAALVYGLKNEVPHYISNHHQKTETVEIVLDWSCLETLPVANDDVDVITSGGAFSQEFTAEFSFTEAQFMQWKIDEPIFDRCQQMSLYEYHLHPACSGAQFSGITFDHFSGKVIIRAHWS